MSNYQDKRDEILDINSAFYSVLTHAETLSVNGDDAFSQWKVVSRGITEKIKRETLRIAVVGSIKSGKSTFVNSLLEGDFLKRGAGVVTSIVTRVRRGGRPAAKLYFKSWDDINTEIQRAIVIFPGESWKTDKSTFDLRREADRDDLRRALSNLDTDHLIHQGELNADTVLLSSYLKGFDRVKDAVSSESRTQTYTGDDFHLHRHFSGDDSQAVYLRDIQLDVDATILNDHLEIADCQGSDSPNPHHLAMIQDYLLTTHLLIYVISSRTGLRRADIRFLSMIKKMGIMDNSIFVINCDFSEHDSLSGLQRLIENANESLALICREPEIFAFSSLYNLFLAIRKDLSSKDQARLSQWELDPPLIDFSHEQTRRFGDALTRKLTRDRYSLLLKNHLSRIHLACEGFRHWVSIHQDLMNSDADRIEAIISRLSDQQQKCREMGAMIRTTLDGAVTKIQQEIRHDVDRFFDPSSGKLINGVVTFIRHYQAENEFAEEELASAGFTSALYNLFQQFKNSVDQFMTASVNPDIVSFVRDTERRIADTFDQIANPFELMVHDAVIENNSAFSDQKWTGVTTGTEEWTRPNLASVKSMSGLHLPSANAVMHYSARIKSDALLRYGAYSLVRWFRKIMKKADEPKHSEGLKALTDGMQRVKRETERSIKSQFMDYREHIKFQYLFKFIDGYANTIHEALVARFASYQGELSHMSDLVDNQSANKQETIQTLDELRTEAERIAGLIHSLRDQLMQPGIEHINQS
jgi:GTPase SAR1 family protein